MMWGRTVLGVTFPPEEIRWAVIEHMIYTCPSWSLARWGVGLDQCRTDQHHCDGSVR